MTGPRPGRRIGQYEILAELGRGGMGVVYRCRDSFGRQVALKMITAATDGESVARLRHEGQAIARLNHPGIVGLIGIDVHDGRPYIVMDLVEGESLRRLIARSRLDARRAAALVRDVALAVDHAHRLGVIHRDIKPDNILIDRHGDPRLTDFGLASDVSAETQLTQTGQILGTPQYMAPEQADGDRHSHGPHTDVWALGAVLYCCVTGHAPFEHANMMGIIKALLLDDPARPRDLEPRVPEAIERIILGCLRKDPAERPTIVSLAANLDAFLDGEEVTFGSARSGAARSAVIVGATLLVLVAGGGTWWLLGPEPTPAEPRPETTTPAPTPPAPGPSTPSLEEPEATPAEPSGARELVEEGAALHQLDRTAALERASAALELEEDLADAHWLRALALQGERDPTDFRRAKARALELYDALERDGSSAPRDLLRAAELHLLVREPDARRARELATKALEHADASDEDRIAALRLRSRHPTPPAERLADLRRVLEIEWSSLAVESLAGAMALSRDKAGAEALYGNELVERPDDVELRCAQARHLRTWGKPQEALEAIDEALRWEPDDVPCLIERAYILSQPLGRPGDGVDALITAQKRARDPDDVATIHARLALHYERSASNASLAIRHYELALEQKPDELGVLFRRSSLLLELGRVDEALVGLRRVVRALRPAKDAEVLLAEALVATGRLDEAAELCETGRDPRLVVWKAQVLDARGQTKDALPLFEQALTLDLGGGLDRRARLWAADAFQRTGEPARALTLLDGVLAEEPADAEARELADRIRREFDGEGSD